ncbi:MAG: hypothetical protein K2M47_01475 [Clostridiales bacterium]|nr:hypothetical protein [Clostridiales bacterium]
MCYSNYNEWIRYIEDKYREYDEKRVAGGFRGWFKKILSKGELDKLREDLVRFGQNEEKLILTAWAQAFEPQYYDSQKDVVIKCSHGIRTPFDASQTYGSTFKNYFKGKTIPLDIPKDGKVDEPYYWILIISALQKRYGIFSSLDDLNEFVFSAGEDIKLSKYGFYVRNIYHISLAYAILHGYSLKQLQSLQKACLRLKHRDDKTVGEKTNDAKQRDVSKTRTAAIRRGLDDILNVTRDIIENCRSNDEHENAFLEFVYNNRTDFMAEEKVVGHWSSLKRVLEVLADSNNDYKDYRDLQNRILELARSLDDNVGESLNSLRDRISEQIKIDREIDSLENKERELKWLEKRQEEIKKEVVELQQKDTNKEKIKELTEEDVKNKKRIEKLEKEEPQNNEQINNLKIRLKYLESKYKPLQKLLIEKLGLFGLYKILDYGVDLDLEKELGVPREERKTTVSLQCVQKTAKSIIDNSLRYLCIYSILKRKYQDYEVKGNREIIRDDLYETHSLESFLSDINRELSHLPCGEEEEIKAGFREIDAHLVANGRLSIDCPRDLFDWFIVEILNYEKKIGNNPSSAFETFNKYIAG